MTGPCSAQIRWEKTGSEPSTAGEWVHPAPAAIVRTKTVFLRNRVLYRRSSTGGS